MPISEELIHRLDKLSNSLPETKSKRLQILVTPTMFQRLKTLSEGTGISVNALVNGALKEYLGQK